MILDLISSLFLVAGGFFMLIAALGLVRFPSLVLRMHAATKASGAAFALSLLALATRLPEAGVIVKAVFSLGFAFATLPVAAHLLGRSAARERSAAPAEKVNPEP